MLFSRRSVSCLVVLLLACVAFVPAVLADDDSEDGVRRDLRELLRHGGRFPEGYVPEGVRRPSLGDRRSEQVSLARISGAILKRYLDVKDDPAKAPVYEQALEVVADALLAEQPSDASGGIGLALMPTIVRGLQDEKTAPACVELMEIISQGTTWFGGARLLGFRLVEVPEGSVAEQMGLRVGDVILKFDGKRADSTILGGAQRVLEQGGQLTLHVLRKEGETVTLEFEFERE